MQKIITIESVTHNVPKERRKDGGTYLASVLTYTDEGIPREQVFVNAFLDKAPGLRAKVHAVEVGQQIELTLEKKGMFWNVTDINAPGQAPVRAAAPRTTTTTSHGPTKAPFTDNSIGMQVGNALTNAATLLAHGAAKGTLESVAVDVLKLGESLKARLTAGEFAAGKTVPVKKTTIVEDLPFGD